MKAIIIFRIFITWINGLSCRLYFTFIISDHSDERAASTLQIASSFKVAGEEITGTHRKRPIIPQHLAPVRLHWLRQTVKRLISVGNGKQIVHTIAVLFPRKTCRRQIDRCVIALWCCIQSCLILQ